MNRTAFKGRSGELCLLECPELQKSARLRTHKDKGGCLPMPYPFLAGLPNILQLFLLVLQLLLVKLFHPLNFQFKYQVKLKGSTRTI